MTDAERRAAEVRAADLARTADVAWGGSEPEARAWSHGRWSLELRGDELADLRLDGILVLRSVRCVARDREWDTVPATVLAAVDSDHAGEGILELRLRLHGLGADIDAELRVIAGAETLRVELGAVSRTGFASNRLGLVILHPPTVAGCPLTVGSDDGGRIDTAFPERIAPHQPALDIRSLAWRQGRLDARLDLEGDVFEMEDQRNWTDASFKTYSTPLSRPFPVELAPGQRIEQALTLSAALRDEPGEPVAGDSSVGNSTVEESTVGNSTVEESTVELRLRPTGTAVPRLSLGASTAPDAALASATPAGAAPPPPPADALLVELDARAPNWRAALHRAGAEARGLPLDIRLIADEPARLGELLDEVATVHRAGALARLGVASSRSQVTEPELWAALVAGAAGREIDAELVGGARSHFTELNRRHPHLPADLPSLAFSLTPQMHATERAQLIESIGMQRLVAAQAVQIAGERPVHVGPVTLRSRYNAVATTTAELGDSADLASGYGAELVPGASDPRQRSAALAAWTVASAAALAVPGVASIAWYETAGPRGLGDGDGPFPVAEAIGWLHELSGHPLLIGEPAGPDVWALGARAGDATVVLVASLRPVPVTVRVEVDGRVLSAELAPFSAARLS